MNPLKVSCIYPDERQHCSHGRHSTPVGSHPILFRPNKRNNHLSSLLPCLAVSKIWNPCKERFWPGLHRIRHAGDKRTALELEFGSQN